MADQIHVKVLLRIYEQLMRLKPALAKCPAPVKKAIHWAMPRGGRFEQSFWEAINPYKSYELNSTYPAKFPFTLGIIRGFGHSHGKYIKACCELGVPYKTVDIVGPDWIEELRKSECDAFLVYPSVQKTIWKQMFDERVRIMSEEMGVLVYPEMIGLWIYESKRKMCYWLEANEIPHPFTRVYYEKDSALNYARQTLLPVVVKSDFGSGAIGVHIFHSRGALLKHVKRHFGRGISLLHRDRRDIQWGHIIFQDYIPDAIEWRVLRLGDSFFAHQKLKKGDYHSGSGLVGWVDPPRPLLDFAYMITEKGKFTSMDLDIFQTRDGQFLVNELQALFGSYLPYQMRVDDSPGRYLRKKGTEEWAFEEGEFNQNGSCNLRVEAVVDLLSNRANS